MISNQTQKCNWRYIDALKINYVMIYDVKKAVKNEILDLNDKSFGWAVK